MKKLLACLLLIALVPLASASDELAKAKNCTTCHALDKKIVGPRKSNEARAKEQANEKSPKAALINDSAVGRFLFGS